MLLQSKTNLSCTRSPVEDAFHACWGDCAIKMLLGWCQLRLRQPKLPCSVLRVHLGPQADRGTSEMPASVQALLLPLAAPWEALTPELTGFQLHTRLASPLGVFSSELKLPQEPTQGGQCVPAMARRHVEPWETPSLHRGWSGCWTSKNLVFLESPK